MSRKIVALRPPSPKSPKVVPVRTPVDTRTPLERAQSDLSQETEQLTWRLKGLGHLVDAWTFLERECHLDPNMRERGLGVVEFAAEQLAERLEAKLQAVRDARPGRRARKASA